MIQALMRRDAARGAVARWAFLSAVSSTALVNLMTLTQLAEGANAAGIASVVRVATIAIIALPALGFLGFLAVERRYRPFDVSLPIRSRDLWLSHTLSSLMWAGVVMSVVIAVTGAFVTWLRADIGPDYAMSLGVLASAIFPAACGVVFAGLLFQSFRPERSRLSAVRGDGFVVFLMVVGVLVALAVLALLSLYWSLLFPVAGLLLARSAYRGLPASFELVERSPGGRVRASKDVALITAGPRRGLLYHLRLNWTLYFSVNHKPWVGAFLGYPFIFLAGVGCSGVKAVVAAGGPIRLMVIPITAYIFVAFTALIPRRFFRTDPWPVSRGRVFAAAAVPFVVVLALGYGVGSIWASSAGTEREAIRLLPFDDGSTAHFVQVPVGYCEVAADGVPPESVSPWGETHRPGPMPVWEGGTFAVYSPFSVAPTSSPEFVALQLSRAVETIYGRTIDPAVLREMYFERAEDGSTIARDGGLTLTRDFPGLRRASLGPVFPVIMLFLHALWLIPLAIACRPLRAGIPEKVRKWTFASMLILLMALHFAEYILVIVHRINIVPWQGSVLIGIRHLAAALPGGTVTVWVVCGVLIAALYALAVRALGRTESIPGDELSAELLPAMR